MTNLIPADFYGLPLNIVDHAGKKWLTAEQVGLALGYNQANAAAGIRNLYNRHLDRFDEGDACRINLMRRDGKTSEQLVFSDTGCITLGWLSNTKRAAEFQRWAKQTLAAHMSGHAVLPSPTPVEARLDRLEAATTTLAGHMAQLVKVSCQQAHKLDVTARYIGLLEINQKGKVRVTRTVEAQVLALQAQGMPQADIARLLRLSNSTVSLLVHGKYKWSAEQAALPPESVESLLERMIEQERAALVTHITAQQGGEA